MTNKSQNLHKIIPKEKLWIFVTNEQIQFGNRIGIKHLLFLVILISSHTFCYSQADSNLTSNQDSLLILHQKHRKDLVNKADSVRFADSVGMAELLTQIDKLKADDDQMKNELRARLDSLNTIQESRKQKIKREVDSLRAQTLGVPVIVFGDTVFYVYSKLGPFGPSYRSKSISSKVEMLVEENLFNSKKIIIHEGEGSYDVMHDEIILFSITDRDAFWIDKDSKQVAEEYSEAIKASVDAYVERTSIFATFTRFGLFLLVVALFYFAIKYLNKGFTFINIWVLKKGKLYIKDVKFKNYEFLTRERIEGAVQRALIIIKWFLIAIVVYMALPVVFSIFPSTKGLAVTLWGYVLNPLKDYVIAVLGFIPELITIVVIILITRYFVRFLKFLSTEVESGKLIIPNFYPEWSAPTFNLLRIIIYAFAFIIIFPYLPGSNSPVFQGVSVFLGLLISLGSSTAIGNIIAGLVITYMRAFKIGDRVKIGDTTGEVIEKTMLVTKVRTIKNEDVSIPNSSILIGSTINYSSSALELGLILNSTVTIGYDAPWRKVHELLIRAALKCEHIKNEPQPYVLQTALGDYNASYQINAYTEHAGIAAKIYSELHANIQDEFNEAGIEILSPEYHAARDGSSVAIPKEYLPKDYEKPSFNIKITKDDGEL